MIDATEQNIVLTFEDADHGSAEADGQRFAFARVAEKSRQALTLSIEPRGAPLGRV
ncbi:hypothetical protein [Caulobacter segnis]|uniref:hypothetical protein n=1 Tax=Caulobacter segnis TaxID=88688 RepID=UPI0028646E4E|nr:hypothetical protein [Caulobacter segnis]MDR6625870.1 hypothetical protein [Caulobacter segnis]